MTTQPKSTPAAPKPALKPGALYLAFDRFVCAKSSCAGGTALFTGRTIHGKKLSRVGIADVTEWASEDLGPMTCECGDLTVTDRPDAAGWPTPAGPTAGTPTP